MTSFDEGGINGKLQITLGVMKTTVKAAIKMQFLRADSCFMESAASLLSTDSLSKPSSSNGSLTQSFSGLESSP
jgi:hypothetical protein